MSEESTLPEGYKLCECGCGETIPIINKRGEHSRFKSGHHLRGRRSHNFKEGRWKTNTGHWLVYKPEHPFCNNNGYVYEHRLIIEDKLNRYLRPEEVIHHINGIPWDNRTENLHLISSKKEHAVIHNKLNKTIDMSDWKCARCNRDKTYIKKSGRPRWLYINGSRLCSSCYSTVKRRINRAK